MQWQKLVVTHCDAPGTTTVRLLSLMPVHTCVDVLPAFAVSAPSPA